MTPSFIHLHLHSEFSLADSTIRIPELVSRCAKLGMPAVALTDQSNLFAMVKFYRAAEAAGIKPLIGADVHIEHSDQPGSRLTLLCLDHRGYLTLSRLLSRGYLEGHRGDHLVLQEAWLAQDNAGLVALAGRESEVGRAIADCS
jgi:DNA polymerase-3 subunit alpha